MSPPLSRSLLAAAASAAVIAALLAPVQPAAAGTSDLLVQGPSVTVHVADRGGIDSVVFSDGRVWALGGTSLLTDGSAAQSCAPQGTPAATADGGATWSSRCTDANGRVTDLTEMLTPTATSISWTVSTTAEQGTYSSGIATKLSGFTDGHTRLFWTASGGSATAWQNPLQPAPFSNMTLGYGGHAVSGQTGFSVPLATIIEPDSDHSLSLVQSLDDPILDAQLSTTASGDVQLTRTDNRITTGRPVVFHMDLVAGQADWRGALGWVTQHYPEYFSGGTDEADRLAGLGTYSSFTGPFTPTLRQKLQAQDVRTNWELSLHGPYFGEYMPPVTSDTQTWTNYIASSGEKPSRLKVSVASLRAETQGYSDAGLQQLAYFNTTEFGDDGTQTAQAPPSLDCGQSDLWAHANAYLYCDFPNAILRDAAGKPTGSYLGSLVMDNGDPAYQQHLLQQAKALMTELPAYAGINIDRLDWLEKFNPHADDGISWYNGGPARSLVTSWKQLMPKLTGELHAMGKQVWVSPTDAKRVDEMSGIDGIQSEFNNDNSAMNMDAFMGVDRPVIGWNYSVSDTLLQHYLYMGTYPQSDVPDNEHGIAISAATDQLYADYGTMFRALEGKKWVLTPHPVSVSPGSALANIFTTPDGVVVPVINTGTGNVTVSVPGLSALLPDLDTGQAEYLTPGTTSWTTVATSRNGNTLSVTVPPSRGTVLVRFPTRAVEGGVSHVSQDPVAFSLTSSGQWVTSSTGQTLTATLHNRSSSAVDQINATINTPDGWTVVSTGPGGTELPPGASETLTWQVRAPDTATGTDADIRPVVTYHQSGHTYQATDAVRLVDGVPYPDSDMTATASTALAGNPPGSAIDGDPTTFWHSAAGNGCGSESITLDLGRAINLGGLAYLPRQDGSENGLIDRYNIYTSTDGTNYTLAASGEWNWDMGLQVATFSTTARYLRLQSIKGYGVWESAAEITPILGVGGTSSARPEQPAASTTVGVLCATATSAQSSNPASLAIDGNPATIWHTSWNPYQPLPQSITLILDREYTVNGITYLPRQDGFPNGNILTYNIYATTDGQNWTLITSGSWADDASLKTATFPATAATELRLEATSGDGAEATEPGHYPGGLASAAEITVSGSS